MSSIIRKHYNGPEKNKNMFFVSENKHRKIILSFGKFNQETFIRSLLFMYSFIPQIFLENILGTGTK